MNSVEIQKLYGRFFTKHQHSIDVLLKILEPLEAQPEQALSLIEAIVKLWDDFDIDSKDFIVGALKRLSTKVDLSKISDNELSQTIFNTANRRRLLRDAEIRLLFPRLSHLPIGYDAKWLPPKYTDDPKILAWLKTFHLVSNPFGASELNVTPFYPQGYLPPNQWNNFLNQIPQHAQCPTPEDAKALSLYLRAECLPTKKRDQDGNETTDPGKQVFPVFVSFNHSTAIEAPLLSIVRSAAQAWFDILCLSPDAMLDLLPAEQETVLELLCWAYGSNNTVKNFLQREGLKSDKSSSLLMQKVEQFQSGISSTQIPQNTILLSWLKIKPPDLNSTYLIIPLDEIPTATRGWWLEQFSPLISTLFLNGVVIKTLSALYQPTTLPLPVIQLDWAEEKLKTSLNFQFETAMDKVAQKDMGRGVDFRSLFGFDTAIGYFATEEETTDKLIAASNNSLARLLTLGNRLLQYHCEHRTKDGVPEQYLYVEDLETILKTA